MDRTGQVQNTKVPVNGTTVVDRIHLDLILRMSLTLST